MLSYGRNNMAINCHFKGLQPLFLVIFSFTSCSWFLDDHRYDYLKEEQTGSLEATEDSQSKEIVDF